jgi:hypothetical protein
MKAISMKKFVERIALAVFTLAAGFGTPAVMAGTASAAVTPVIYNYASGWNNPAVKPQWVLIGQGGSPMVHTWHWNTWTSVTAKSTGTLWTNNCVPNCAYGKTSYHKLYVTMSGVKYHNGRAYYSVMTWYTPGYHLYGYRTSTAVMHFSIAYSGATAPMWH